MDKNVEVSPSSLRQPLFYLDRGAHLSIEDGACTMELVSYIAHEPWSSRPKCACPILTEYVMTLNDEMSDAHRQRLRAYLVRLAMSKGDSALEKRRLYLFIDYALRAFAPFSLTEHNLHTEAEWLRGLPRIVDAASAEHVAELVKEKLSHIKNNSLRDAIIAALPNTGWDNHAISATHHSALAAANARGVYFAANQKADVWALPLKALSEALAMKND